MAVHQNGDIARRLYDSVNKGDLDGACALVSGDLQWLDVPRGLTWYGPDGQMELMAGWDTDITGPRMVRFPPGFKQYLESWLTAIPDLKVEVSDIIEAGNTVIAQLTLRGTHRGMLRTPYGNMPGAGRSMEITVCHLLEFKDGKIVAGRCYYDMATIFKQMERMRLRPAA